MYFLQRVFEIVPLPIWEGVKWSMVVATTIVFGSIAALFILNFVTTDWEKVKEKPWFVKIFLR